MKKTPLLALCILLSLPLAAEGPAKYQHPSTGTTITFPRNWNVKVTDAQMLAVAPDSTISFLVQGLGQMDIQSASGQLKGWVGQSYQNLQTADAQWSTLGGMKVYFFRYQASFNGTALEGMAMLADAPKGVCFLLSASQADKAAGHRAVLKEIFGSFGKL